MSPAFFSWGKEKFYKLARRPCHEHFFQVIEHLLPNLLLTSLDQIFEESNASELPESCVQALRLSRKSASVHTPEVSPKTKRNV